MRKCTDVYDSQLIRQAISEFRILLHSQSELEERKDLQPFFKKHPVLIFLLAGLGRVSRSNVDEYEFEFDLWQDLVCDIGIGDSRSNTYCLIELEAAKRNSIFKNKPKNYPKYSDRLECGYSQIIDWFFKIDEMKNTSSIKRRFAGDYPRVNAVLIIGRSHFLNADLERNRFNWRRDNTLIGAKSVNCLTYDELLEYFESKTNEMEDYKPK
jgi:Domain of unknown function (DUF4263)